MSTRIDFSIEFTKTVFEIRNFIVERRNLINSITFDGDKWISEQKNFEIDADGDIDIFAIVEGNSETKTTMKVKVKGKKSKDFEDKEFDKNGRLIFNEAVILSELENE